MDNGAPCHRLPARRLEALQNVVAIPGRVLGLIRLTWARYVCAFIISVVGYGIAWGAGRSRLRAGLYGLGVLTLAFVIAAIKHSLTGH
jgi:hypothetical protein